MNTEYKIELENKCKLDFKCTGINKCQYCKIIKNGSLDYCKYQGTNNSCVSAVAKVNSVVLEMKRVGLDFKVNHKDVR